MNNHMLSHIGALSVRPVVGKGAPKMQFAVYFEHGHENMASPGPSIVPYRTLRSDGRGLVMHPLGSGTNPVAGSDTFRTKTAAHRYLLAVHAAGILPSNNPATRQNVLALRDWIEAEAAQELKSSCSP
ncbi:hypothetical protein ANMWB30_24340 [Arthrobacter sp. MWB30]|nr:hypothetical protein ANMWB30_24340 [Arthrobacter sp. MWB30]